MWEYEATAHLDQFWSGTTLDGEKVAVKLDITDEMVERAARLDHATDGEAWGSRETWDDLGEKGQRDYLDHARRLLEAALRPPDASTDGSPEPHSAHDPDTATPRPPPQ